MSTLAPIGQASALGVRALQGLGGALAAVLAGAVVARLGALGGMALLLLVPALVVAVAVVRRPVWGLYLAVVVGFFGPGLTRYTDAPTGLILDAALALTVAAAFLRLPSLEPGRLANGAFVAVVLWLGFTVVQLFNPLAPSAEAWFYAGRGSAFYLALAVPLGLLLFRDTAQVERAVHLWLGLSVVGLLWGLKQQYIGLDAAETAWINQPGNLSTHVLFGRLRVFSFYADAGQFGAGQGLAATVAGVLVLRPGLKARRRLLYAAVAATCLWGLLISGTRGALAVPFAGGVGFLLLSGRWKLLLVGLVLLASSYGVLRYTWLLHDVYEIQRVRWALIEGTENPSLQVRLQNQERLAEYLADKPLGGGVGSAGSWGQRFSPGTFLADLPLDSWYVRIWAEYGPVGLGAYVLGLIALLVGAARRTLKARDARWRWLLLALFAGVLGIAAASYGNQVLGQMPVCVLVYLGIAALYLGPRLDPALQDPSAPDPEAA